MTREEFAIRMGFPVDNLPHVTPISGIGWEEIYATACKECGAFNLLGLHPSIHQPGCENTPTGKALEESIIEHMNWKDHIKAHEVETNG